jgi:hypothetical protein
MMPWHLPGETEDTTEASVGLVGVGAEIQSGCVQNTTQKYYYLSHRAQLGVSCHVYWRDEKCLQNFSQKSEWRIQGESSWMTG